MEKYDHRVIEAKQQKKWWDADIDKVGSDSSKPKSYVLDMFPYPSGEGLHVGHPKGYIATDIYSRLKKMQGYNILHPMGWDAFGLPAENYALKNKVHPKVAVDKNITTFKSQLKKIGFNYDWEKEINTTDPEYYKWTQWIFLKLFEKGLAYQSHEPINWCPSCQTGLANEDLEGNRCERCGSEVEKRPMRQWMLKITDYADRLLNDLGSPDLKWPESIKTSQKNWIGRSEGLLFTAPVKDINLKIQTFSAHFEAFRADTFVVIAPDHPLLLELVVGTETEKKVLDFARKLVEKRASQGYDAAKEPEGIFTGRYIVDPVGNSELPIWVANYAIADYGTGIVKCSAHDERDFVFAKKYNIYLKPVLVPQDESLRKRVMAKEICYTDMDNGVLLEPKEFAGRIARECKNEIIEYCVKNGLAERKVTYRLKDWVFSRQRYWGEPIPIIHCNKCGAVPVPESELPVKLPAVEHYEPTGTGESPLATIADWVNTVCPKCGGAGKRETNTMPQWAGSSWYYLAYACKNPKAKGESPSYDLLNKKALNYWNPVDVYVGGAEHATRHLIYARFWHKFLYDLGIVSNLEPFVELHNVGLILAEDGKKMSKRYGNVVNPDEIVELYGADSLRLYTMFIGPFADEIAWSTKNIIGVRRFLEKVWRLRDKVGKADDDEVLHSTIKKVTEDILNFRFNTAISALMIQVNAWEKRGRVSRADYEILLKLLSPLAPHLTDELWERLGHAESVHLASWPKYDITKTRQKSVKISVQINDRVRGVIEVPAGASQKEIENLVLVEPTLNKWLSSAPPTKVIYIPNRTINFIT